MQFDGTPGRARHGGDPGQQGHRPAAEGEEGDPQPIQPGQVGVGGEPRIEHQVPGPLAGRPFPGRGQIFRISTSIGVCKRAGISVKAFTSPVDCKNLPTTRTTGGMRSAKIRSLNIRITRSLMTE